MGLGTQGAAKGPDGWDRQRLIGQTIARGDYFLFRLLRKVFLTRSAS
ncbi:hypothetical protein SIID45300_00226 [Candidatus Magnetaquicoccaceae bacterium FCR-1]|uniref:Uncharacterized protein n=1 Tax=Candidatus Magnetaquiglobus chichijimensis TaxID=3141448 RepID=A0ABQ0C4W7_9PROT